jgi:shikimate 5-dehydrogenase
MPHKRLAYELCDVREPEAERAGAVNTLSMSGTDVVGSNTDVMGIAAAWQWRGIPRGVPVNILGSGGAAAAALVALDGFDIWVIARRPEAAVAMIERTGVEATVRTWGEPLREGVLVNATPLGMRGDSIPAEMLAVSVGLFDMAYTNRPTLSVVAMREQGVPVAEGIDMLVGQAVGSFEIWTGVAVDPMVMRAAAHSEVERRAQERESG